MRMRRGVSLVRIGSALALVALLAGCTKGGQFDPTEMFNSDMFDSKKKLSGQREPLFPQGVPGTSTGVPSDLVKGYQPPPEPAPDVAAAPVAETPKPKPKPKPKIARAPAQKASPSPTHISIGLAAKPATPARQAATPAQSAPEQNAAAPRTAQQGQSIWPDPPQAVPSQQAAQPAQSIWPNPPSAGPSTR